MCSDDEDDLYAFLGDGADPTGTPPRRSSSLVRIMKKFISLGKSDSHRKKKRKQGQGRNDDSDGGPNYSWEHHQDIKKAPKRKTSSFLRNLLESKSKSKSKHREKQGRRQEEDQPAPTASSRHRKFVEGQQREQKRTKTTVRVS
ncbi:expressed unknown protein [Seminavis robusta]|uniref:Uncharacterized protein n=1 Tax=Seminavis robusta TaxID=568900 RepID=A0A9N8HDX7_9STRA|nr:expressed unknown protein [Seminavis robusta]|eukprot:Sro362_g126760.1 n/a (144) ;mRNA; r:40266-40697